MSRSLPVLYIPCDTCYLQSVPGKLQLRVSVGCGSACASRPGGSVSSCVHGVFSMPFPGGLCGPVHRGDVSETTGFLRPDLASPEDLGPCEKTKCQLGCCWAVYKMQIQALNHPRVFEMLLSKEAAPSPPRTGSSNFPPRTFRPFCRNLSRVLAD